MRVFSSDDKEIIRNGPYPATVNGERMTVTEELTVHLFGDGSGFTCRSPGRTRYLSPDNREVKPDAPVERIKWVR